MYSYTPDSNGKFLRFLFPVVLVLSICAVLLTFNQSYGQYVRLIAFALVLADILVLTKGLLTSYTYTITNDEGPIDLVITRRIAKNSFTVCRVSVAKGRLTADDNSRIDKNTAVYNYKPGLFEKDGYRFYPCEEEGGGVILFSPDETLVTLLYKNGASE